MIIYIPAGNWQKGQKLHMTPPEYKTWLTKHGDSVRILRIRRGDPANKPRGEDPDAVYYYPCIELYRDNKKVNFHFLGATQEARAELDVWLGAFNRKKTGYFQIVDKRRKKK